MHHVAPLFKFVTLACANVKCEPVQVPFTSSSCYFVLSCTRVDRQNTLGPDTIISVLGAPKLLLLIVTVCPCFYTAIYAVCPHGCYSIVE
jgi:hypothetical protein